MSRFLSAAVSSLLLLADPSSSTNLRSVAEHDRRLSFELIAMYEPKSQVTDQAAIDLDQLAMEDQLAIGTEASFEKAKEVYEHGGHSKSVAKVKLSSGLPLSMVKSTSVSGQTDGGVPVYGKLFDTYPNGATTIEIQYQTIDSQKNYVNCQVGGLSKPNLAGCFGDSGTLSIDGTVVSYTYNPKTDNVNKRTLKKFSSTMEEKMYRCGDRCPYRTAKKFRAYYGFFDYADRWIEAAFDGGGTDFDRGNANFVRYNFKGKAEAIQKASAYMSVWLYVTREMEQAIDGCKVDCKKTGCNDDQVKAWDEAIAFYTGSLEGIDGQGRGNLMYDLADEKCKQFKTCGSLADRTEGLSHVNEEIFRYFTLGSRMLAQAKCEDAIGYKERIEDLMTIPLIQGILRNAFIRDSDPNAGEIHEAQGATFAASLLPIIYECDQDAHDVIYNNMKTQSPKTDFKKVKKALESVYDCMRVNGKEVGGVWNEETGDYYSGAKPTTSSSKSSGSVNIPLLIGCTAGGLVAGFIMYLFVSKCCCTSATPPVELKEDPMGEDADDSAASAIMKEETALPSTDSHAEPVEIS